MSKTDETTDGQSGTDRLEQRIAALEEENEHIKHQLEQQQANGFPDVTRRGALAGLLGGGALLGAAGSASAAPPSGPGGPPFVDEDHDHSGDQLGEGEPVESIRARTVHDVPYVVKEENSGISDRDIVSGRPIQIWVDPDGDNSGAGTEEDPVASLQEALNRLPYILTHPVDIVLTSGTAEDPNIHDTGVGVMSGLHMSIYHGYEEGSTYFEGATGLNIAIRSESGNPEDTVLYADYFLSFYLLGNSPLNVGMKDLTVEAGIQTYGGVIGCLDCVLRGSPAQGGLLFSGYAGTSYATRCEITATVVSEDSAGAVTGLNSCTVDPGDRTDPDGEQCILKQYNSGATVFVKGGDINVPWFGTGAMGFVVTLDNIYHPAAPDGIIDN